MNVNKLYLIVFFTSFICFSQTNKTDAYYILDIDYKGYVINAMGKEINNIKDPYKIDGFRLYDRTQYLERKKQIEKDKKERNFNGYQFYKRPLELVFNVIKNKKELILHCDTHFLNLVDYKWIQDNTWKENNPGILFKDLYFLLKTGKDEYLKFKVARTIIAR